MRRFLRDNGLSVVMLSLFAVCLVGQAASGFRVHNQDQALHDLPTIEAFDYLQTGHFIEAVFENWESEFLQMGMYVLLTVYLFQKGSPDANAPDDPKEVDAESWDNADVPWPVRRGGLALRIYEHSLSLTLFLLFFASLVLHAAGGTKAMNAEAAEHGEPAMTFLSYFTTSRFWFESLQNWQSEFLSVAVLVLLSIFLRERNSPESKPINPPYVESASANERA